ncbi:39S mitochondrial ribosomal protein L46-domain-containing protein [Cyathus striatus]|nr:39S mitochondrial ribosomal protein L46-domain-containing protein [Cyathus striatus]
MWKRRWATVTNQPLPSSNDLPPSTVPKSKSTSRPHISTAVILNRSPLLTRTLSPFEQAYHAYQARIRRALHNPFPTEFYFKQGSLLETRFNLEEQEREVQAFGDDFVRDDYANSEKAAADRAAVEQLAEQEGEGEQLAPREPPPEKGDLLHQAAQKDLYAECGEAMDTWVVSRSPVGVYKPTQPLETTSGEHVVFFFKAHIMAGQVNPQSKNLEDFAWLTKEEIKPLVDSEYWAGVKDILSDY